MAEKQKLTDKSYQSKYLTYNNIFWLFMVGNVLGVILEGSWCYFLKGAWETHVITIWGPFCLIYGIGLVGLYIISIKLKDKNFILKFLTVAVVLDFVEYVCSWVIDYFLGLKAWDYSGSFLNIKGRISLNMTILWGVAGILFSYLLIPPINRLLDRMQGKGWKIACTVLSVFMLINMATTAVCIVRWSQRHFDIAPRTVIAQKIDNRYNDEFMQKKFIEWSFIR